MDENEKPKRKMTPVRLMNIAGTCLWVALIIGKLGPHFPGWWNEFVEWGAERHVPVLSRLHVNGDTSHSAGAQTQSGVPD